MTVQPGFGGQKFRQDVLPKMEQISQWRQEQALNFRLEVDGGIDLDQPLNACKMASTHWSLGQLSSRQTAPKPSIKGTVAKNLS